MTVGLKTSQNHLCSFCMCVYIPVLYVKVLVHPGSLHWSLGAPWAALWWFLKYEMLGSFFPHRSHLGPLPMSCFTHMCRRQAELLVNVAVQLESRQFNLSAPWAPCLWSARLDMVQNSFSQKYFFGANPSPGVSFTFLISGSIWRGSLLKSTLAVHNWEGNDEIWIQSKWYL